MTTRLPRWTSSTESGMMARVEELGLVDADDVDLVQAVGRARLCRCSTCGDDGGLVGLRAVAGDGGAVVAEVDVGLVAGDALAGDAGTLEAADQLFGFAGEHGAGDDFNAAWDGGHEAIVAGLAVDFASLSLAQTRSTMTAVP